MKRCTTSTKLAAAITERTTHSLYSPRSPTPQSSDSLSVNQQQQQVLFLCRKSRKHSNTPTTAPCMATLPTPTDAQRTLTLPAKVAFISGPLEPSPTYFEEYYAAPIALALAQGHHFVLATSHGIDTLALKHLLTHTSPNRVTLFLSQTEARSRYRFAQFERAGGKVVIAGRNHTQRDEALTRASHCDILRYWTEGECRALYGREYRKRVSGTEKNEIRRRAGVGLVWREVNMEAVVPNAPGA